MSDDHMPDNRPRPRYGELAPEGETPSHDDASSDSQGEATYPPLTQSTPLPQGAVAGVPHNLGARSSGAPQSQSSQPHPSQPRSSQTGSDEISGSGSDRSYRAAPPTGSQPTVGAPDSTRSDQGQQYPAAPQYPQVSQNPEAPQFPQASPYGQQSGQQPKNRQSDRIITIVLLVVGALGALYTALSMMQLPASFHLIATTLEFDDFVAPASIETLGTVGALVTLALYAVTLIYSIQRMRAKKLTFWVPLAAGALSIIIAIVISMIAMSQAPDLMQQLADPGVAARLLEDTLNSRP